MVKKIALSFICFFIVAMSFSTHVPQVAITFGLADTTAKAIVNFILAASNIASLVSLIGIIFGVGGFSLAVVQTVKYLAKKSFTKAVAW
ncbi:circular bacteriocin, circularin A/uberolysin family [Enterococcus faecalis]